ncbi:hypothetical protein L9F63_008376, partial [Diploptera punctata]
MNALQTRVIKKANCRFNIGKINLLFTHVNVTSRQIISRFVRCQSNMDVATLKSGTIVTNLGKFYDNLKQPPRHNRVTEITRQTDQYVTPLSVHTTNLQEIISMRDSIIFRKKRAEGENVSKLEKADILELTVRHLHRLRRPRDAVEDAHRFQPKCRIQSVRYRSLSVLLSLPGLDARVGRRLVAHLGQCQPQHQQPSPPGPLSVQVPATSRLCYSPPISPSSASPAVSPVSHFRSPQP